MFGQTDAFNQDIGSWNVSSVTNFVGTFNGADAFNQDIGSWDVSAVTSAGGMTYMLSFMDVFNQDLSGWCVDDIGGEPSMFDNGSNAWAGGSATRPQWGTCPGG